MAGNGGSPEGTVIVTYALGKVGKTADALLSAPTAHYFTTAPRQLDAWTVLTGVRPREHRIDRLKDVARDIRRLAKPGSLFVFDDASIAAAREERALVKGGAVGWSMWKGLNRAVADIKEECLAQQALLWFIFHEKGPKYADETVLAGPPKIKADGTLDLGVADSKKGVLKSPGGPVMPSENLGKEIPYISPLVLRGTKAADPIGGWKGRYYCDPQDPEWVTGDRFCVCPTEAPMNMREILRAAAEDRPGVIVPPRAPGLSWLDDAAEGVAKGLASGQFRTERDAAKGLTAAYPTRNPLHLRWAWRDGCARAVLRKGTGLFDLFTTPQNVGTGLRIPG